MISFAQAVNVSSANRGEILSGLPLPLGRAAGAPQSSPSPPNHPISRLLQILGWAAAFGLAICIAHLAFLPLANGDMYWQVRAGEIILGQRRFLADDIFSYTVPGTPWNNHEWLFEVLLASLYRWFGWLGLRLLVLLTVAGAFLGVGVYVARRAGGWMALGLACAWLGLVWYKLIPAAQTASMVLFLLGYWAFLRPGLFLGRRKLALFAMLLVWGNLSAEVVVFLPFLVVDQIFRALRGQEPDLPRWRRALWLSLALVVPLINAPGASVAEYVLDGTLINRSVNSEFAHLWEAAASVHPSVKVLAWLVVAAWSMWTMATLVINPDRQPRLMLLHRTASSVLAVSAALLFERNLWMLILPMVQMTLALHRWLQHRSRPWLSQAGAATAAAGFFVLFQHALPWWGPGLVVRSLLNRSFYTSHLSGQDLPLSCDDAVQALGNQRRMLTSRLWGNWMIWRFPDRPVFIDGRNREYPLYLHRLSEIAINGAPGAQDILDAFRVGAVLAQPGWLRKPGVRRADWHRVFATPVCALYVRQSPSDEPGR